jgi:hypothetical protein
MTMKYFTPQRWLQLQDWTDEQVFHSAQAEWERAISDYRENLSRALPSMPGRLRQFAGSECLHDATILGIWQEGSQLSILLRPEPSGDSLYLLLYSLLDQPHVVRSGLSPEYLTEQPLWMYDEIGVEGGGKPEPGTMDVAYTHTILLSNGWEVGLRFRQFEFSRPQPLFPVFQAGHGVAKSALSEMS